MGGGALENDFVFILEFLSYEQRKSPGSAPVVLFSGTIGVDTLSDLIHNVRKPVSKHHTCDIQQQQGVARPSRYRHLIAIKISVHRKRTDI